MQIMVFVTDGEELGLDSLERILKKEKDITVVGTATTAKDAIEAVRSLKPNVVLMDLLMKGNINGVEATRELKKSIEAPSILALTESDISHYLRGALDAGATGFMHKQHAPDQLATGIRMAHDGDPMISPEMTTRLIKSYVPSLTDQVCMDARDQIRNLSHREIDVAALIGQGKTYDEIAKELFISPSTVKAAVRSALHKIDAVSGAQLAVLVAQARLDLLPQIPSSK